MNVKMESPASPSLASALANSIKEKESFASSGITITEYLINNYPPASTSTSPYEEEYSGTVSMVPLRNPTYYSPQKETRNEENNYRAHTYCQMDVEEVKKARRRMKNKISAQESRRRKKEYLDSLEVKLKQKDQEKRLLKDKVTELEEKVRVLVDELFLLKQQNHSKQQLPDASDKYDVGYEKARPKCVSQISRATQTGVCLLCFLNQSGSKKECDTYMDCYEGEIYREVVKSNEDRTTSPMYQPDSPTSTSISVSSSTSDIDMRDEEMPPVSVESEVTQEDIKSPASNSTNTEKEFHGKHSLIENELREIRRTISAETHSSSRYTTPPYITSPVRTISNNSAIGYTFYEEQLEKSYRDENDTLNDIVPNGYSSHKSSPIYSSPSYNEDTVTSLYSQLVKTHRATSPSYS